MKRKLLSALLSVVMLVFLFSLAGCGSQTAAGGKSKAKDLKIGIITSDAGRNDNGYNASAIKGAIKASKKLGVQYKIVDYTNGGTAKSLTALAQNGYNLIFTLEYDFNALIKGVGNNPPIAKQFPHTTFVVFNDNPNVNSHGKTLYKNVISVMFNVHQASFLAGAASVLVNENAKTLLGKDYKLTPTSQERAVGFIGGTNSNGITVFSDGYVEGVNYVAHQLGVHYNYFTNFNAGFTDPALGSSLSGSYFNKGANVVFASAGVVGDGVTAKAKQAGKLAIQVDANKDSQQPGHVLTSTLKNTQVPVYKLTDALVHGSLKKMNRVQNYSLASGATGITDMSTLHAHIAKTAKAQKKWKDVQSELTAIKKKINNGQIKITNAQIGEKFHSSSLKNVTFK
ncbi:MAG: BMP family protein [Sporolactobacillus sp.]